MAKHVRRRLGADKAGPFMATVHRLGDVWEKYRDFRGAVENANREAVAKATLRETGSMKAAMFAAKDAMDFSMRGDSLALRLLTDTVPFLNARIQGLDRLARAGFDVVVRSRSQASADDASAGCGIHKMGTIFVAKVATVLEGLGEHLWGKILGIDLKVLSYLGLQGPE